MQRRDGRLRPGQAIYARPGSERDLRKIAEPVESIFGEAEEVRGAREFLRKDDGAVDGSLLLKDERVITTGGVGFVENYCNAVQQREPVGLVALMAA